MPLLVSDEASIIFFWYRHKNHFGVVYARRIEVWVDEIERFKGRQNVTYGLFKEVTINKSAVIVTKWCTHTAQVLMFWMLLKIQKQIPKFLPTLWRKKIRIKKGDPVIMALWDYKHVRSSVWIGHKTFFCSKMYHEVSQDFTITTSKISEADIKEQTVI